jgi:hypothetical protein
MNCVLTSYRYFLFIIVMNPVDATTAPVPVGWWITLIFVLFQPMKVPLTSGMDTCAEKRVAGAVVVATGVGNGWGIVIGISVCVRKD